MPTTPMAHSKLPSRTRKGRAAKETAVSILDVQQEAFLASLSALERRALAEMLNRVYTNQAEVRLPNVDCHAGRGRAGLASC